MVKKQKLKLEVLRFRLSDLTHEGDHTPTQSGNILFVCFYTSILAISLLKTLTIAFICKNTGYFCPIRLTENKANQKSTKYIHNRECEVLSICERLMSSDKVNR